VFAIGDFEYEYVPFPSLSNHPRLIWDTQLYLRNSKVYLYYLYFAHVRFDTPKHTRCVQFLIIYLPIGAFFAELAGALMAPTHRLALYIGYGSTPIRLLAGLGAVPLWLAGAMDPRSACARAHPSMRLRRRCSALLRPTFLRREERGAVASPTVPRQEGVSLTLWSGVPKGNE
jgi:hypothetical protein